MILQSSATALNIRSAAAGAIIGEMRLGDKVQVAPSEFGKEWVEGTVTSGVSAGVTGFIRRRWLIQSFEAPEPTIKNVDRSDAAKIVAAQTAAFDAIAYGLGAKSKTWNELSRVGNIDCSGWVYLVGKDILTAAGKPAAAKKLYTYSDAQIINVGMATKAVISGQYLLKDHLQPGTVLGIDNAEYSWDRHRALDIDHVVIVGEDADGRFISQSSSTGGGVNRVPLDKWWQGASRLASLGRVHLVDLLAL